MSSRVGFLSLPRELRDTIYYYYVFEANGYHFEYESGKLRANDRPIDLALMYTCTSIAAEMHYLPLNYNVIHFSTVKTEASKAAYFGMFFSHIEQCRRDILNALTRPEFRHHLTPDLVDELTLKYPQFAPLFQEQDDFGSRGGSSAVSYGRGLGGSSFGEASSAFRSFQIDMLAVLSRDTEFAEPLAKRFDDPPGGNRFSMDLWFEDSESTEYEDAEQWLRLQTYYSRGRASFLRRAHLFSGTEAWNIPSEDEVAQFVEILDASIQRRNIWEKVKWRFSAAAAAVHFFKSIARDTDTYLSIRRIALHEDRLSVAHPECHVLGLIPFCLQNRHLRIERHVNVWKTLSMGSMGGSVQRHAELLQKLTARGEGPRPGSWRDCNRNLTAAFGSSLCRWITEAMALSASGMPEGVFSLVLDGEPAPDQSSKLFEQVKEDAAWQVAHVQHRIRRAGKYTFRERCSSIYLSNVFPQAINDIVEGKSFIRCNFPTGELHDPAVLLDADGQCTDRSIRDPRFISPVSPDDWVMAYVPRCFCRTHRMQILPPLPSNLGELALEDWIPEIRSEEEQSPTT